LLKTALVHTPSIITKGNITKHTRFKQATYKKTTKFLRK